MEQEDKKTHGQDSEHTKEDSNLKTAEEKQKQEHDKEADKIGKV